MGDPSLFDRAILLVDTDRQFRHEAAKALYRAGWDVREAASGEEALALAAKEDVALAIIEIRLFGISGYEVCRQLRELHGDRLPIVFVSHDRTEAHDRVAGLLVGADDYLVKPVALDELVVRTRRLLERSAGNEPAPETTLTAREHEVLVLLVQGLGPADIAAELAISTSTVATHIEHLYGKLGVHTRAQAVASAFRLGLVEARPPVGAATRRHT